MKTGIAVVSLVLIGLLGWGGYELHWYLAKHDVMHQRDVNTHTQQYQDGIIQGAQDDASGWMSTQDPGQKAFLQRKFCAEIKNINELPNDLRYDSQLIGCAP
jgi:hypothetical protein